jgi:hypothetical protein
MVYGFSPPHLWFAVRECGGRFNPREGSTLYLQIVRNGNNNGGISRHVQHVSRGKGKSKILTTKENRKMETTTRTLRQIAEEIALALGTEWKRDTKTDADDTKEGLGEWRAVLNGQGSESLFLSTTWGQKGKLYVSGSIPTSVDRQSVRVPDPIAINISMDKTAPQIARDITRRLLPEYRVQLAEVLKSHASDVERKEGTLRTKNRVAQILNGRVSSHSEVIYGTGSVDIQVCGPDSLRFSGHCLYLTTDQLERMRVAIPELFQKTN